MDGRSPLPAHLEGPEDRETLLALLSGVQRKGAWEPAEHVRVFAVMGGVEVKRKHTRGLLSG